MTGSEMNGLILIILTILLFVLGSIVLAITCLGAMVMPVHWVAYALAGLLYGLSGVCWLIIKLSERSYYANRRAERSASKQSVPNEKE